LATAREELAARAEFDVTVVNDDLNQVVRRLVSLLVGAPGGGAACLSHSNPRRSS
jgi:guanylate kinase